MVSTTELGIVQIRCQLGELMHLRSYTDFSPLEQARWDALIEAEAAFLASTIAPGHDTAPAAARAVLQWVVLRRRRAAGTGAVRFRDG